METSDREVMIGINPDGGCVWKKEERRCTFGERELCLGMRERKVKNSLCERFSCT